MDYEILPFGLSTEIYDMSYVAKYFYNKDLKPMLFPCGDFADDQIDELIRQGETTADLGERAKIYTELYKLLYDEQPLSAVYSRQCATVKNQNLNYAHPDILKVKIWDLSWNA